MQTQPAGATRPGAPPGWYSDPWQVAPMRWWDGVAWTSYMAGAPVVPAPAVAAVASVPVWQPAYVENTPRGRVARNDVRGGGIAILGFFGANAMGIIVSLLVVWLGAPSRSVAAEVGFLVGLWSGLTMTAYVVTHRRPGGTLADVGFSWPTRSEVGTGFGMAFVCGFIAGNIGNVLDNALPQARISDNIFYNDHPSALTVVVMVAAVCVGAPIFEELFFRGVVQTILTRSIGVGLAILLQAMMFGMVHYQYGMTAREGLIRVTMITGVGLILGWLRSRTGRLGAGIVTHATYNAIVCVVVLATLGS